MLPFGRSTAMAIMVTIMIQTNVNQGLLTSVLLKVGFFPLLSQLLQYFFYFLGFVFMANQHHVRRINHNHIFQSGGGNEFVVTENEDIFRIYADVIALYYTVAAGFDFKDLMQ